MRLELVRDGAAVAVVDEGDVELVDQSGAVRATVAATVDARGGLAATIPAGTSDGLQLGQLYQLRWNPTIAPATQPQRFRREAVVALFRLVPPVADADLTRGSYPDLIENLGGFRFAGANGEATLQPFIDEAWAWVIRRLLRVGRWPDLIVSTHDLVEVTRERSWFLVFRFLFRSSGGDASRFERLMEDHGKQADREWAAMSARWDLNHDGLADSEERDPAAAIVHRNAAPRRRLSRSSRW